MLRLSGRWDCFFGDGEKIKVSKITGKTVDTENARSFFFEIVLGCHGMNPISECD